MNMTVIVASAMFTSFGFLALIGKCSNKWLKRVLGYEYFLDVIMSLGMMFYFGLTGSITGIIVSAITGCPLYPSGFCGSFFAAHLHSQGQQSWLLTNRHTDPLRGCWW